MSTSQLKKYDLLNEFEYTNSAMTALVHLLTAAIDQGEDYSFFASGIFKLFDDQCSRYREIEAAVRDQYRAFDEVEEQERATAPKAKALRDQFIAEKAREGVDASEIAQAVNLKRSAVEKVIAQLTGTAEGSAPPNAARN